MAVVTEEKVDAKMQRKMALNSFLNSVGYKELLAEFEIDFDEKYIFKEVV